MLEKKCVRFDLARIRSSHTGLRFNTLYLNIDMYTPLHWSLYISCEADKENLFINLKLLKFMIISCILVNLSYPGVIL